MHHTFGEVAIRQHSHPCCTANLLGSNLTPVILRALRIRTLWRLLQIDFMTIQVFRRGRMSVKAMMATILHNQLKLCGIHSLRPSDYEEIVELLIDQIRELELGLAARETADKRGP